jgi:hypothetical protein
VNEKKVKKLRQLVRHLQNTGAVGKIGWTVYNDSPVVKNLLIDDKVTPTQVGVSRRLHPDCGRAVYQAMKKNARGAAR